MWIKWWKYKISWILIITALLSMFFSFLSAKFIIYPYNIIIVLLICFIGGQIMYRSAKNAIEKWIENKKQN